MTRRLLPVIVIFALVLGACSFSSTPAPARPAVPPAASTRTVPTPTAAAQPTDPPATQFGAEARGYIRSLTGFGPRIAGTQAESRAAQFIASALTGMGYSTKVAPFSGQGDDGETVSSANVVAVKPGSTTGTIVVGAHYDSVDVGQGADDNASGVAVLLEAADLVKEAATPYSVVFIAFGAEEPGLVGSYAYVDQLSQAEIQDTVAMINLDSVSAGNVTYVYGEEPGTIHNWDQGAWGPAKGYDLRDWTLAWAGENGLNLQTIHNVDLSQDGGGTSDYAAFQEAGIPFIYFEATDWSLGDQDGYTQVDPQFGEDGSIWHTPDDALAYLDATFPGRVDAHLNLYVRTLVNILTQYRAQP